MDSHTKQIGQRTYARLLAYLAGSADDYGCNGKLTMEAEARAILVELTANDTTEVSQ